MRKDQLSVSMSLIGCCTRDRHWHRSDVTGTNNRTGEELYDVASSSAVFVDYFRCVCSRLRLRHLCLQFFGKLRQVVRQCMRGKERDTCGHDARTQDFAAVDASPQCNRILSVRAGIYYRREARVGEHLAHLA